MQAVTGSELFLVDNQTLVDHGIESESGRQAVLEAVEELRAVESSKLVDFYQFKIQIPPLIKSFFFTRMYYHFSCQ